MGLFDWLTGKKEKADVSEDRIWLSKKAKLDGIENEIALALADGHGPDAIFVVAHFQDCLDELQAMVSQNRFDLDRLLVALAEALPESPSRAFEESRNVLFIIGERHPLPSHDERILRVARSLSCRCRLVFNSSLDDALLQAFSGEWLEGVLKRLGMKEDEAIESRMVSRRLRDAQQRIAKRATGDKHARSAQEWMEQNCPPTCD